MNRDLKVALRVLNLARERCPTALSDLSYIRAVTRVLVALGDAKQIRWLFQVALSKIGVHETVTAVAGGGSDTAVQVIESNKVKTSTVSADGINDDGKLELALTEEFLAAELTLGTADLNELASLRAKRDALKLSLDEQERVRVGAAGVKSNRSDIKKLSLGIFGGASEFVERYSDCFGHTLPLPQQDLDLRDRTSRRFSLNTAATAAGGGGGQSGVRRTDAEFFNLNAEFQLSLAGLPLILRDLLSRLPSHSGPSPDIDLFVRHLKSITLPPRPSQEESDAAAAAGSGGAANWMDANYEGGEVDREEPEDQGDGDLFRKRQRARLDLE